MVKVPTKQLSPKRRLSEQEIKSGISRLEKRVEDLEGFDPSRMQEKRPPELDGISTSILSTLAHIFGEGSGDFERYSAASQLQWSGPRIYSSRSPPTPLSDYIKAVSYNKEKSLVQLRQAIRALQEDLEEGLRFEPGLSGLQDQSTNQNVSKRIFIVHGRDNDAKNEVARFLSKIGLEEIILHERPNKGRHLLTKFQEESEGAAFAVILLTPDDEGALPGEEIRRRARQNVVFEFGFFIGRLGAARVAALVKTEVEKPSDLDGVAYITLDPTGGWKGLLARELTAAKIPFEAHKVFEV